MKAKRFQLVDNEEAEKLCGLKSGTLQEYYPSIVECVDGKYAIVGSDGGEPEDQSLCRDWNRVLDALNDAYYSGYADGEDAHLRTGDD